MINESVRYEAESLGCRIGERRGPRTAPVTEQYSTKNPYQHYVDKSKKTREGDVLPDFVLANSKGTVNARVDRRHGGGYYGYRSIKEALRAIPRLKRLSGWKDAEDWQIQVYLDNELVDSHEVQPSEDDDRIWEVVE